MDLKDIRLLKILEKVEAEHLPSQRELAKELNISLGSVNSFIKRLTHKNYIKAARIPNKRIKYTLTSEGALEKTRLGFLYIQYSYQFYKNVRQKLRRLFVDLETGGISRIIFYGACDLSEIAYLALQETSIELVAVVDDLKIGKRLVHHTVEDPAQLKSKTFDKILITAVKSRELIIGKLLNIGISLKKIVEIQINANPIMDG